MGGFLKIYELGIIFSMYMVLAMRTPALALALTKFTPCLPLQ